jgi:hypothetical protein
MEKNRPTYTKLSALVGDKFTIQEARGYTWKRWNQEAKRFEISEQYAEGFKKTYSIVTDKGILDLGSGQLSTLLEAVYWKGTADINGKTFSVKSNGETGMNIRYYFNVVRPTKPAPMPQAEIFEDTLSDDDTDEWEKVDVDLSDVPF